MEVMDGVNQEVMEQLQKIHDDVYCIECEVMEGGQLPMKAHATDAGFDLYATADFQVMPGQIVKHPLNIKLALPAGTYAQITSKSGLGSKGLLVFAGIIDESYRGIPHVVMTNLSHGSDPAFYVPIEIKKGMKLAQLIMHSYAPHYFFKQVDKVSTDTVRGSGGFGSSGAF